MKNTDDKAKENLDYFLLWLSIGEKQNQNTQS